MTVAYENDKYGSRIEQEKGGRTYRMPVEIANQGSSACITSVQAHLFPFNRVTINVKAIYVIPSTPAPTTVPINTVKNTDMNASGVPMFNEFT